MRATAGRDGHFYGDRHGSHPLDSDRRLIRSRNYTEPSTCQTGEARPGRLFRQSARLEFRDPRGPGNYTDEAEAKAMALSIDAEPIPLQVDPHGTVRVGGTRLTLETALGAFKRGDTPDEIVAGFPGLELADVYALITYYLRHQADVEEYLRAQEAKAAGIRRKIEARQGDQRGLRARLLHRARQQRR